MSDDSNHDVTLDSTAFSLHFRNIALADDCTACSTRSMRTPTGDATTADAASIIVPTGSKNPFVGSKLFAGNLNGSVGGSSNMSLIEEKSSKYDYEKLSPTLVNLLDQVNRSLQTRSPKSAKKVIASDSHLSEVSGVKEYGENETPIRKAARLNATGDCPLDSHLLEGSAKDTTTEQIVNSNAPEENIHLDYYISQMAEASDPDVHDVSQSEKIIKFKESCQPLNTSSEVDHLDHSFVQDSLPAEGSSYRSIPAYRVYLGTREDEALPCSPAGRRGDASSPCGETPISIVSLGSGRSTY
ncbi:hypothetical protein BHE74_00025636 [Ensete ventricosum]|nr:hypothetical protein BHE74_00025636 [Ensete ventricosum]